MSLKSGREGVVGGLWLVTLSGDQERLVPPLGPETAHLKLHPSQSRLPSAEPVDNLSTVTQFHKRIPVR